MINLGDVVVGSTVRIPWNTNGGDGASITRATNGTIQIYKNGGTTQRASASGVTDTEDFDTFTGMHVAVIDLSDNADAGFYAAGAEFLVAVTGMTIDGKSVNAWIGAFSIERCTLLKANMSGMAGEAARSLLNAVRFLRNKWAISGSTLSVKKEDDSTEAWNAALTTAAGADPISGVDPA